MTREHFQKSLESDSSPSNFSELQKALWHAAKGSWDAAHHIAQKHEGEKEFDLLHAYLHRVEGDEWNAHYWYQRAGATMPGKETDGELEELINRWIK